MTDNNKVNIPEEYQPISMWGYFGYTILFDIPLIGFIAILIYAFGGTKNINLKNFARSFFCIWIIAIVIFIIAMILGLGSYVITG